MNHQATITLLEAGACDDNSTMINDALIVAADQARLEKLPTSLPFNREKLAINDSLLVTLLAKLQI